MDLGNTDAQLGIQVNRTAMAVKGFPFIEFHSLAGSLAQNPRGLTITGAALRAEGRYVTTRISANITYYAAQRAYACVMPMPEFVLQVGHAASTRTFGNSSESSMFERGLPSCNLDRLISDANEPCARTSHH